MTCSWPIDRTCLPDLPELTDPPSDAYLAALETRNAAEDLAIHVLWALSGRQFGACEVTVRPCPTRFGALWGPLPYMLTRTDGHWVNWPCGCLGACELSGPRVVHLPGPVTPPTVDDPITVTIAGETLPEGDYALEGDVLYRVGGVWPAQNLGAPLGESDTWAVTYRHGILPPNGTAKLAGLLAREFLIACTDSDEECRLPSNVTQVNRRGVSYAVYNPNDIYTNGKTGLAEIDSWLAAINPHHLAAAPSVL